MKKHISFHLYQSNDKGNYTEDSNSILFDYPCQNNSICMPYEATLNPGIFFVELWGAQGGGAYRNSIYLPPIGLGGYSSGFFISKTTSKLFLYIGGQGSAGSINSRLDALGGYNGGGDAPSDYCHSSGDRDDPPGAGGGASDIRTQYEEPTSRIAVAGGGGGNGNYVGYASMSSFDYGFGGGLISGHGYDSKTESATQEIGNADGKGGKGTCSPRAGGGGGGGYRGGFGGFLINDEGDVGSGGSGFIDGLKSFKGINPVSIAGNTPFISPYGKLEIGHTGHGAIKITIITSLNKVCDTNPFRNSSLSLIFIILFLSNV